MPMIVGEQNKPKLVCKSHIPIQGNTRSSTSDTKGIFRRSQFDGRHHSPQGLLGRSSCWKQKFLRHAYQVEKRTFTASVRNLGWSPNDKAQPATSCHTPNPSVCRLPGTSQRGRRTWSCGPRAQLHVPQPPRRIISIRPGTSPVGSSRGCHGGMGPRGGPGKNGI
jgi:hypothetical protein